MFEPTTKTLKTQTAKESCGIENIEKTYAKPNDIFHRKGRRDIDYYRFTECKYG
jgi:uncharacterized ParB-like nuclease family protein